eukprot:SAG22_NODE_404_length_11005_cov_8.751788_13_plen_112_part_00
MLQTLNYGNRSAFVHGLEDLIAQPVLTMEEECTRAQRWTDWKGIEYTLTAEWDYVNGPAQARKGCTPVGRLEAAGRREGHERGSGQEGGARERQRAGGRDTREAAGSQDQI